MKKIKLKRGLNIPLGKAPAMEIVEKISEDTLAFPLWEFPQIKARLLVESGERIKSGQPLLVLKENEQIRCVSPVSGRLKEVRRGAERRLMSLLIEKEKEPESAFKSFSLKQITALEPQTIREALLSSGLWILFRQRPLETFADTGKEPAAILINTFNSYPHVPPAKLLLSEKTDFLQAAINAFFKLSEKVFLTCKPEDEQLFANFTNCEPICFQGPHPAGTAGVQIHYLCPVNRERFVWHISLQNALRIGRFFLEGVLDQSLLLSFCGPAVENPHYLKTEIGFPFSSLIEQSDRNEKIRLIAGSAIFGQKIDELVAGCGWFQEQITALTEDTERRFLGWAIPGFRKFTQKRLTLGRILHRKDFQFNTNLNGSPRPIVPIGGFEEIFPFRMHPTYLLKNILTENLEEAEKLGCLELAEEDLALCTLIDAGKNDFSAALRKVLNRIKKESL